MSEEAMMTLPPSLEGAEQEHDVFEERQLKARRISAELIGDMAVEADLITTMLRLDEKGRSKVERDTLLVEMGVLALNRAIEAWRKETGKKFPSYEDMKLFLSQ